MMEALAERPGLHLDCSSERGSIELHVGEVVEQDVDGIRVACRALELLAGQDRLVRLDELVVRYPRRNRVCSERQAELVSSRSLARDFPGSSAK